MEFRFPHQVPGWLTPAEGLALYEAARDKTVLEIGAYKGRSTICLAQSAKVLHSVDWGFGDAWSGWEWTTPALLDNLIRWFSNDEGRIHFPNNVILHVGRVEQVAHLFANAHFDMVFVDGAHDYESALRDIQVALRCLPTILALHDWNYDSIQNAYRLAMKESFCHHCGSSFGCKSGEGQCEHCRSEQVNNLRIQHLC